jgi:hypothetical protein
MRLVDDVGVPFSSVKFRIRIDGTQISLTEVGMESRAVQLPAAKLLGLRLSTTLTMMGAGLSRQEHHTRGGNQERPDTTPWC